MRRNFFVPSSGSPEERDLDDTFGWLRILLKECAAATAAVDIFERRRGPRVQWV